MNLRTLTIERATAIILFILVFALAARIPADTDVWWHIRSGETILQSGIIDRDPFSYTFAGEPWIDHSWLSQIVLYGVWTAAGAFGLSVLMAGLATVGMIFVYRASEGSTYLRAFAIILGAATAAVFWSPRPQMASFVLSALLLYLLSLYRNKGIDRLWWIPPMFALWGNLHAGFSIGFILLFGTIVGESTARILGASSLSWRAIGRLVLITGLSIAALLINPYGVQMLAVPFQTLGIGALQNFIQEWNSPNFHERQTWPFLALLLGILGAVGGGRKPLKWTDFLLVSGTAFMAFLAGRNIALFAVVATPVFAKHLDTTLSARGWVLIPMRTTTRRMAIINLILIGFITLGAAAKVLIVLDEDTVRDAMATVLPIDAVEYLRANPTPGNLFNSYNWGGYIVFALPETPVFVDGRTDLYGDTFLTDSYLQAATASPNWREILERYGVNTVFVEAGSGLGRALDEEPGWQTVFEDAFAVIAVRETPIAAELDAAIMDASS